MGLNLGEVLRGDRIFMSDYNIEMLQDSACNELCTKTLGPDEIKQAQSLIMQDYQSEWIIDNLPGATSFVSLDRSTRYYSAGFPLGYFDEKTKTSYLYNHFILLIRYRRAPKNPDEYVVVAFEVYPKSVAANSPEKCPGNKDKFAPLVLDSAAESITVPYTYTVYFKEDESIEWESRWNKYLSYMDDTSHIHWLSLVNSLIIATLLATFVAIIVIRTLNRDITNYNKRADNDLEDSVIVGDSKDVEYSGWKLVFADVFRPPINSSLFASLIGSGMQFFVMTVTVVGFSCLGVLNPSYRGGLLSYALFLFAFSGVFSGYVAERISKNFGSERWGKIAILTALVVPGAFMLLVIILNFFVWSQSSSSALPFGTLLALMCIWAFISCPLVLSGAFLGNRVKRTPVPVEPTAIPRQIPRQPRYKGLVFSALLGGLLPFAVIFVELRFVLMSVWQKSTYYYMYGFLALVFGVLVATVMEMSIVVTYFQLSSEDYRWYWKSFIVGTGSAWWIMLYSVYYYVVHLNIDGFIASLMYFAYTFMGCVVYGLITGSIGFLASYFFVFRIYSAIKAD